MTLNRECPVLNREVANREWLVINRESLTLNREGVFSMLQGYSDEQEFDCLDGSAKCFGNCCGSTGICGSRLKIDQIKTKVSVLAKRLRHEILLIINGTTKVTVFSTFCLKSYQRDNV